MSTYNQVKKLVDKKGIEIDSREYHCRGSFGPIHSGKPDENDLQKARDFAREIVSEITKKG